MEDSQSSSSTYLFNGYPHGKTAIVNHVVNHMTDVVSLEKEIKENLESLNEEIIQGQDDKANNSYLLGRSPTLGKDITLSRLFIAEDFYRDALHSAHIHDVKYLIDESIEKIRNVGLASTRINTADDDLYFLEVQKFLLNYFLTQIGMDREIKTQMEQLNDSFRYSRHSKGLLEQTLCSCTDHLSQQSKIFLSSDSLLDIDNELQLDSLLDLLYSTIQIKDEVIRKLV